MGAITNLRKARQRAKYTRWPRDYTAYRQDMAIAAGIGTAQLRCHRHTWEYLRERVARKHGEEQAAVFHPPKDDEIDAEEDGMITVSLSGTALAALLNWCYQIARGFATTGTALEQSIGQRVGSAVSQALEHVAAAPAGAAVPRAVIYLDDRITDADTPA